MFSQVIAWCLPLICAGGLPWQALPDGGGPDGRLEAAFLMRDIRAVHAAWERQRRIMAEVPAGQALLDMAPGMYSDAFATLLNVVAPHGTEVPGVVALISADERLGVVVAGQVEPDFLERLRRGPMPGVAPRDRWQCLQFAARAHALGRAPGR